MSQPQQLIRIELFGGAWDGLRTTAPDGTRFIEVPPRHDDSPGWIYELCRDGRYHYMCRAAPKGSK